MATQKKGKPWSPKEPTFGSDLLTGVIGSIVIIILIYML